jgi:hypothetical protein
MSTLGILDFYGRQQYFVLVCFPFREEASRLAQDFFRDECENINIDTETEDSLSKFFFSSPVWSVL